ncbi:MAG: hypothetical protein J0H22_15515, partial [Actinobacteria bacterium]|nr:hypothetical protein [Actinomycetota bacterium]
SHYRLVRNDDVQAAETEHRPEEHITVVPFGSNHSDLPEFLASILSSDPFRAVDDSDVSRPAPRTSPTGPTIPIVTPLANQDSRNNLSEMAARFATVKAVAADTYDPRVDAEGEVVDPAVRDVYIRFQNLFADEAEFVVRAAAASELTQAEADAALGVGRRLAVLLDNPPQH